MGIPPDHPCYLGLQWIFPTFSQELTFADFLELVRTWEWRGPGGRSASGFEANQAARKDAVDMKNHQWLGRHLVITPQNPWGLSSHGLRCLRQSEMCNVTCHLCFWTAQSGHHLETCETWWNGLRKALFFMLAWSCQTGVRRQSGNALGFSCTGPWDDHSLRPQWPPAGALGVLRLHCNIRHIRCRGGTTEDNC